MKKLFLSGEIKEEYGKELILKALFNSSALTVQKGLMKMLRTVSTMHRNAIKAFITADARLAEETIKSAREQTQLLMKHGLIKMP